MDLDNGMERLIREVADMKAGLDSLTTIFAEKFSSLDNKLSTSIEMTRTQIEKKHAILDNQILGLSERLDEKIREHDEAIKELEKTNVDTAGKRHGIHVRIDEMRESKIEPLEDRVSKTELWLKLLSSILGVLGTATVWTILEHLLKR